MQNGLFLSLLLCGLTGLCTSLAGCAAPGESLPSPPVSGSVATATPASPSASLQPRPSPIIPPAAAPPAMPSPLVPPPSLKPAQPAGFRAIGVRATQLTLVWEPVPGAETYRLYQNGTLIRDDLSEPSLSLTGLAADTEYQFRIEVRQGELSSDPVLLRLRTPAAASGGSGGGGGGGGGGGTSAVTPSLTGLSLASSAVGTRVTIFGTGFSATASQNRVRFNGVLATVRSARATELSVEVPAAASGGITVELAGRLSNALDFNVLPAVSLSAPTDDALLHGSVILRVAPDSGNPISKVEFFSGTTKLGESSETPYAFSWNTLAGASGPHVLRARVIDSLNNTATSEAVIVQVDQVPVIADLSSSISPLLGLSFPTRLSCTASDLEGPVTISWSTVGGNFGSFSASTGAEVYWTSPASAGGPYTLRCSASDGVNPAVTRDLSLSVIDGSADLDLEGGIY